jgi:putative methyltransferase (TIGR04325 family)
VVVNQMPTHPGREFYTVQHIGVAYCAYRVAAEDALPAALAPLGYELVDRWEDPSRRTAVPYHDAASPIAYSGYYLRRR